MGLGVGLGQGRGRGRDRNRDRDSLLTMIAASFCTGSAPVPIPIATKDLVFSFGMLGKQNSLISFKAFREEIWKHSILSSPYLCQMVGWVMDTMDPEGSTTRLQSYLTDILEGTLSILLEYLPDSDLYGLLNAHNRFLTWEIRLRIARDIATGMVSIYRHLQLLILSRTTCTRLDSCTMT
jgi:hypothetical protein